jgi:hypothetical protein
MRWLATGRTLGVSLVVLGSAVVGVVGGDLPESERGPANLLAEVSAEMVYAVSSEPIDRTELIRDEILGTDIWSLGHALGEAHLELVPCAEVAVLDIVATGHSHSKEVGYKWPVTLNSHGTTLFQTRKRLFLDDHGIHDAPPWANARLKSDLDRMSTDFCAPVDRLVRTVAQRVYQRDKGLATRIATEHARAILSSSAERDIQPRLAEGNRSFADGLRQVAERGLVLRRLHFSSTWDALEVAALVSDEAAALTSPPPAPPGPWAAAVRAHESLVAHAGRVTVGGKTLTSEQIEKQAGELLGPLGQNFKLPPDETPWSLTLDKQRPVSATFSDHHLALTLRLTEFTRGEDRYEEPMDVTARYHLDNSGSKPRALRDGPLEVYPPGYVPGVSPRLSARQTTLRTMLMRRFGKAFPEEIPFDPLPLTGQMERLGSLAPVYVDSADGWFVEALQLQPK